MRRIIELLSAFHNREHWIRLNNGIRSDLAWWGHFMESWNGISLMPGITPLATPLVSDASGSWGCGAYWGTRWFRWQWVGPSREWVIAPKELLPILFSLVVWGRKWSGCCIECYCDNMAVVAVRPGKGQNADASLKMHVLCGCPPRYPDPCEPRTRGRKCSSRCTFSKLPFHLLAGSAACGPSTNTDPSGPSGHDGLGAARLDIGTLGATVQCLFQEGLAPSTQRVYLAGKKKYLCFCQETSTPHLPVTEFKLVNFVAYATSRGLKHQTIKCYLSAIHHLQIERGGETQG